MKFEILGPLRVTDAGPVKVTGQRRRILLVALLAHANTCVANAELQRVVDADPFGESAPDHARYAVAFLSGPPAKSRLAKLAPDAFAPELFHLGKREIYLWYPDGIHRSKLNNELTERNLGVVATVRNWNTVRKLAELST